MPSGYDGYYLSVLVYSAIAILIWEQLSPKRPQLVPPGRRWLANGGLLLFNSLLIKLLVPLTLVGVALLAEANRWGLLYWADFPYTLVIVVSVLLMDLSAYLVHRTMHYFPVLWRIHKIHHCDVDFDFSTGFRFHPLETLISMGVRGLVILALGCPVEAVIALELWVLFAGMFTHGNINLHLGLEHQIRRLLVTPDMHRIHHSVELSESNSNYGIILSVWDRLFGSYVAEPGLGHKGMIFGVSGIARDDTMSLPNLIKMPFSGKQKTG